MAYDGYTSDASPNGVPGTSTAAALYNVPADMAAVVVKMTKQRGTKGTPATPAGLKPQQGLMGVTQTPATPGTADSAEYRDWAEHDLVTYDRMLARLGLMSGGERGQWQKRLWDAGMYKKTQTYVAEAFDEETQSAWSEVVERAAKQDKSITEVLDEGAAQVAKEGGVDEFYKKAKGAGREPLVTRLTSNVDIGVVANEVAQKRIGRFLTPDELARFAATYHGQEAGYQTAAYNQSGATGSSAMQAPALDNAAEAFAVKEHPVEAGAQREVALFEKVKNMFTQGVQGVSQTGI